MEDGHPETVVALQMHTLGVPVTAYGNSRIAAYNVTGVPTVWYDGFIETGIVSISSDAENIAHFESVLTTALQEPCDVIIEILAMALGGQSYRFFALITTEPGGMARTVNVNAVDVLDHYPDPGLTSDRHCVRQGQVQTGVALTPGETVMLSFDFTFDADSWNQQDDIEVVVFVQDAFSGGQGQVHQAEVTHWPFELAEDCNANDVPDFLDIADGTSLDCNTNAVPDVCDIASGTSLDCNGNDIPDACDVVSGLECDVDLNLVPDACECLMDASGDGTITAGDLDLLLPEWGDCAGGCTGDFDCDGRVDLLDYLFHMENWNLPCD